MPTTEDAPLTTAEIRKILREKLPPAGPNDATTIYSSLLLSMSERSDAQAQQIAFLNRQLNEAIGSVQMLARIVNDLGGGGGGADEEPEQPAPGGQRVSSPSQGAPGGDDGPPIPMQTKQVVSTGPIPGVTAPAAPPPPVVVVGAPVQSPNGSKS